MKKTLTNLTSFFFVEQILTLQTEKDEFLAGWKLFFLFFFVVIPYGKYVSGSERYVCLL